MDFIITWSLLGFLAFLMVPILIDISNYFHHLTSGAVECLPDFIKIILMGPLVWVLLIIMNILDKIMRKGEG